MTIRLSTGKVDHVPEVVKVVLRISIALRKGTCQRNVNFVKRFINAATNANAEKLYDHRLVLKGEVKVMVKVVRLPRNQFSE